MGKHLDRSKAFERRVADAFCTERNPLSGQHSKHDTCSDTLHETLYVEAKSNVSHPVLDAWQDYRERARRRDLPVCALLVDPGLDYRVCWHVDAPPVVGHTHPTIADNYLVMHYRKRDKLRSLFEDTVPKAHDEDKVPVLAAGQKGRPGFWVVCRPGDVDQIVCAM